MSKPKVLITHCEVPSSAIDLLRTDCDLIINDEKPYPNIDQIKAKAKGVDAILWSSKLKLNEDVLNAAGPQMKVVATMSAGVDNIDLNVLRKNEVKLANTPIVLNESVADLAIGLALAACRRFTEGREIITSAKWTFGPQWFLGRDLFQARVGIVGFGGIGQAIARRLKAFDVTEIMYSGHSEKEEAVALGAKLVDFQLLCLQSDFIFACCPLNDETRGMFNAKAFGWMHKSAVFVNVGRGELVVQKDLVKALQTNNLLGAGLDVMTPEPLPKDHELLKLSNCVLTPHVASATKRTRDAMAELCAQNILRGLGGEEMFTPVP
ncbi:PREDICTED: glyoxylate reductase/hydroxypyruvate reductase-like [Nicrophorus vespilloides]|uniref:Glyoxylate reductase/hydroxypyruvate reductase-like n=1 Tax=Nicrophorus vespilloides TaxID=110193 RepID=A0ABM1MVM6_NICVS|nr:PREDICTED: glyoxylate reductase/hydroxypyruvate reductase-like [Nicrophorus vespilloides]